MSRLIVNPQGARRKYKRCGARDRRRHARPHTAIEALAARPGILIAVVAATLLVAVFRLATRAGVSVLGSLPQGLPLPRLPFVHVDDLGPILMGGLAVALVSFADTSVLSRRI